MKICNQCKKKKSVLLNYKSVKKFSFSIKIFTVLLHYNKSVKKVTFSVTTLKV